MIEEREREWTCILKESLDVFEEEPKRADARTNPTTVEEKTNELTDVVWRRWWGLSDTIDRVRIHKYTHRHSHTRAYVRACVKEEEEQQVDGSMVPERVGGTKRNRNGLSSATVALFSIHTYICICVSSVYVYLGTGQRPLFFTNKNYLYLYIYIWRVYTSFLYILRNVSLVQPVT